MSLYTELTQGPLAAEIAPYIAAGDDASIYGVLTRKDITVKGNLSVHAIKEYISLISLRLPILDSITTPCREFNLALEDFEKSGFDLGSTLRLGKITSVLDALVADITIPDFTEEHKLTLLSLGNKVVSRADQLGYPVSIELIAQALRG